MHAENQIPNANTTPTALHAETCSPLSSRPRHRIEIRSSLFDGWKTVITLYDSDDETAKAKSKEVFCYYRGCLESRIIYEENRINLQITQLTHYEKINKSKNISYCKR